MGQKLTGSMMGYPIQGFGIHGYDMYSKSYVSTFVSNNDTALTVSRGPSVDPTNKVIVEYGVLREYMTGELDKPYKVVWRMVDDNHFAVEIWDLGAGESGMRVITYDYTRVKK